MTAVVVIEKNIHIWEIFGGQRFLGDYLEVVGERVGSKGSCLSAWVSGS